MWDARTDHARAMGSQRTVLISTMPGAKDQERLAMQDSCTKNKVPNQCFHTMPPVPPDCCKLISRTVKLILRQDGGGRQHAHRDLQQSVTKCWYTGSQEPGTKDQEPRNKRQGPRAKDQDSAMHGPTAKYIIYIYIWLVTGFQFSRFQSSPCNSRFPGPWSFNFPDSQILSDKLSDPNLTPFPTHAHMHAGTTHFARSPRWHIYALKTEGHKAHGTKDHAGAMDQEPRSKSQVYIKPRIKSHGPRAKDREPRNNQCRRGTIYRHNHFA